VSREEASAMRLGSTAASAGSAGARQRHRVPPGPERIFDLRLAYRNISRHAVVAALLLAPALAHAESGLSIETGSPDALCPELETTRAAVQRRLGELVVPGGSSGFRARYTIAHAPSGTPRDFVRLELFGPDGVRQLERDLPLEGESCGTMADVIALVLDRYFRALLEGDPAAAPLAANPDATAAAPAPAPTPAPVSAAAPPDGGVSTQKVSDAASSEPTRSRLALEAGVQSDVGPMLGGRGLFELWPDIYLGTALHLALSSQREELEGGGEVEGRGGAMRVFGAYGLGIGPVLVYAGPGLSLRLTHGAGDGLEGDDAGYRATWAAGLDLGALWAVGSGWAVGAVAALDVSIPELGGRFYVGEREVLEPETLQGWFGVSAGHEF
jgi:hypothetical protein